MKYYICITFALFLSGCVSAQLERERDNGGRVVISGSRAVGGSTWMKKAEAKMLAKCPQGFDIKEKGWQGSGSHVQVGYTSSEVKNRYIEFECK